MEQIEPIPNVPSNGNHTAGGRFSIGNKAARGILHPHAVEASRRAAEKRRIFSGKDQKRAIAAVRKILDNADSRPSDLLKASEIVLAYRHGKPVSVDESLMAECEILAMRLRIKLGEKNES